MTIRNLECLLAPHSVALIGASDRPGSIGATVLRNLMAGGFKGPIWPVNTRHRTVGGRTAFPNVAALPAAPDLAILCTPPGTLPGLIRELGRRGGRAAIVITAGLEESGPNQGETLTQQMLKEAQPFTLRILGPNCLGLLLPRIGLNASFAHTAAVPGGLAFIAQSGALATAMLDWTRASQVGLSALVSLGNAADVDFGDLLDYFARDPQTSAILLYIESIRDARKFLSAGRAAARNKPVIVVKAGRSAQSAKAVVSHTGALAGADDVYDAAFRRAGMLRVADTRELLDAAETLARLRNLTGERLAIVSNGGGPAVMATDAFIARGGTLAALGQKTLDGLADVLPRNWSHGNPVDIVGDAPAERYVDALRLVLGDSGVDAVLLIHAPTAIVPAATIASRCVPLLVEAKRPVLACWMGAEAVAQARQICAAADIATYATPEEAVSAFSMVVAYQRNQRQLTQAPPSIPESLSVDPEFVRAICRTALAQGRSVLTEVESKAILDHYAIPVVPTRAVPDAQAARVAAAELGFPVALKILSRDITHKSDVGGVALRLTGDTELQAAADAMLQRCRERCPQARLEGFTVQPMIDRPGARELIVGLAADPTFGPVILFGQGGVDVEAVADRALALPPLNSLLAAELIARTRVNRLLDAHRNRPAADRRALEQVLVHVAQLAVDIAELAELDINPLLLDERGAVALDARIRLQAPCGSPLERLAIRPYPKELEEWVSSRVGRVLLRPIRPEDLEQHRQFLARVDAEDLRTRFLHSLRQVPPAQLASFTQLDYERAMALIVEASTPEGVHETLAVARAHMDPDGKRAEFAILVRSDLKRRGLGSLLLKKLVSYCRGRGVREIFGDVLRENVAMLTLAGLQGFKAQTLDAELARVTLALQDSTP